jgi:hypothetical protein
VSCVDIVSPTFPVVPLRHMFGYVFGHQLCCQIDGREGAYLSNFPPPILSHFLPPNACDLSLTYFFLAMIDADGKPLPPLPPPDRGDLQYGPTGIVPPMSVPAPMHHPDYDEYADDGEYYHPDDYGSVDYGLEGNRLSTISEVTERSEYPKHYPSARQVVYRDSISSNTEYGAFRGMCRCLCIRKCVHILD